VCIRLYSEQDFNDRPRFAQPEIQRSNLADVILRMKAFGLGAIEEFPFLNAPPARGIRAGYALLEELGALVKDRGSSESKGEAVAPHGPSDGPRFGSEASPYREYQLTELGRDLAHLPVDPTVGRMILQARQERAMHEVLVIAAALSIQDPRERPLDQQQKADAAHRRFVHPDSDFLTLLAIWDAYHDEFETMTLGKLRKFCTSHFLSFQRMREWRDIHAQLIDVISDRDGFSNSSVYDGLRKGQELSLAVGTPAYRAIHRSILTGLLGNVAIRADDGSWHAAHDRKTAVFPGSALFEKTEMKRKPSFAGASEDTSTRGKRSSRWLMAAEIMETGRLYARTCARIDPQWIVDLGGHVIRASHSEPFWSAEAGKVLVKERRRLYNLEIETRAVAYGRIDPAHATEIFIREGLVGDTVTWPFDFLAHNRRLREKTEAILTRTRSAGYLDLDEAAYRFFAARLEPAGDKANPGISSVPDLVDFVRHRQTTEPKFLFMSEQDLKPPAELVRAAAEFPESLPLENRALPLNYLYKPGQDDDGVTLRVTPAQVTALTPAALDWAVPGHLREKIELMLKALPKEQRRSLIPLAEASANIADRIGLIAARSPTPSLAQALAEILTDRLEVKINPRLWEGKTLPEHLRVRVEVVDHGGVVLAAGRELKELQERLGAKHQELSRKAIDTDSAAWRAVRTKWEKPPAIEWAFGDLPEGVAVAEHAGVPVLAWLGLQVLEAGVGVRLFASAGEAAKATRRGLARLLESALRYDLGWLEKDLRDLRALGTLTVTLVSVEQLRVEALQAITRWICDADRMGGARPPGAPKDADETAVPAVPRYQLKAAAFEKAVNGAKAELRGLVPKVVDWLREALTLRLALQTHKTPYSGLEEDLATLLPANFLACTPYERWPHLARYLKGMQLRADRWKRDPAKDAQRAKELEPFVRAMRQLGDRTGEFRWLVEEFRVSLFAQELGTAGPVSAVRLQKVLEETSVVPAGIPVAGRDKSMSVVPLPTKGRTVLKSLDALGNLKR
jgi:ATP-dependent helicase HrpA